MPIAKDIRILLKDPSSKKDTLVYLKFACSDTIMKYSTGYKINPEDWNKGNQRPNDSRLYRALNKRITTLTGWVEDYVDKIHNAGKSVYCDVLANHLRVKDGKEVKDVCEQKNAFFTQVKSLIDDAKSGRLTIYNSGERNGNLYTQGTLKHWDLAYNKLFEFNPNLTWDITIETYNNFVSWCNLRGFMPNYTGTIIKMWKVFMNLGLTKKWHSNHVHLDRNFKKLVEKKYKIYLNEDEIQSLIKVSLDGKRKEIRDRFIINLNTGLRISDMKQLTVENYKNGVIKSINQKTGITTAVPANKDVRRILEEYRGFPKNYHEFTINRVIKEIAREAGIIEPIEFTETIGGKKVKVVKPKCDLITCHTCRRSFITNKLKQKISIADVAKFAGSSIKNIEHYNKETVDEVANRYLNSVHFN